MFLHCAPIKKIRFMWIHKKVLRSRRIKSWFSFYIYFAVFEIKINLSLKTMIILWQNGDRKKHVFYFWDSPKLVMKKWHFCDIFWLHKMVIDMWWQPQKVSPKGHLFVTHFCHNWPCYWGSFIFKTNELAYGTGLLGWSLDVSDFGNS
jgi:hypothetical protein